MLDASQTNPSATVRRSTGRVLLDFMAEGEEPLGCCCGSTLRPAALCWGSASEGNAHIAYTGVDPAFRGRGLGYLVKQEMHRLAYAGGARACLTSNEEHNHGIRHVNATLGYRKVSGSYWVHRPV
jgi:GNAT superfamily N-acetyltransferase